MKDESLAEGDDGQLIDYPTLEKVTALDGPESAGPGLLEEYLEIFFRTAPQRFENMRRAIVGEDRKSMYREAHTLKTNCAYVGAKRLQALCTELQDRSEVTSMAELGLLIDRVEAEYSKVKAALQNAVDLLAGRRKKSG